MRPHSTANRVHVLAVSANDCDHVALSHIFSHTSWEVEAVRSIREAKSELARSAAEGNSPVILCDESLADGSWKDLLEPHSMKPSACLIVSSHRADDRLWAEVLNLGAYDVLAKPFRPQEVFRTVGLAWQQSAGRRKGASRAEMQTFSLITGAVA